MSNNVWRVIPGFLSVTRAIGDFDLKLRCSKSDSDVIIAIPDIVVFEIDYSFDFIILGSRAIMKVTGSMKFRIWILSD
jgi:serine/threonine protein phosphatase PrpC